MSVYVPRFKRQRLEAEDEHADARSRWNDLKATINSCVNKVNTSNMLDTLHEFFAVNLLLGRGLLVKAVMKACVLSPTFSNVYAAVIAVINVKLPVIGELCVKRVVHSFKRAFKRCDKHQATSYTKLLAHLVNYRVAHELIALELLSVLIENPTNDSISIAIAFLQDCGSFLLGVTPTGINSVFHRLKNILNECEIDSKTTYAIEQVFLVRKSNFKGFPQLAEGLDELIDLDTQITYEMDINDTIDREEGLDIFLSNREEDVSLDEWETLKKELFYTDEEGNALPMPEPVNGNKETPEEGDGEREAKEGLNGAIPSSLELDDAARMAAGDLDEQGQLQAVDKVALNVDKKPVYAQGNGSGEDRFVADEIQDFSEQDLVKLRRTIYLTIMGSAGFEECASKLLGVRVPKHLATEMCNMVLECCSNEKSYQKFYGLISHRLCFAHQGQYRYDEAFEKTFGEYYSTIHRLQTNKLRNIAKCFAYMLESDSIRWGCMNCITLTEEDTTSSSRIFIKILWQELNDSMGNTRLQRRVREELGKGNLFGCFPLEDTRTIRFSINFFTSIGLGHLTEDMRELLKK